MRQLHRWRPGPSAERRRHEAAPALHAFGRSTRQVVRWVASLVVWLRYHLLIFVSSIRHSSRFRIVVLAKSEFDGKRPNAICACLTAARVLSWLASRRQQLAISTNVSSTNGSSGYNDETFE